MSFSSSISHYLLLWLLIWLLRTSIITVSGGEELQTYIINLDHSHKPASFLTHESWHRSILNSLSQPSDDEELLLYSYNHAFHGFSARLTQSQLSEIEKSPAHVATYEESFGKLFTTHSPKFLGLEDEYGLWPTASYGEGAIIGLVDTGIWPESESFSDMGMPAVPQRWKGRCENGTAFSASSCNRKLIGARSFSKGLLAAGKKILAESDYNSARDYQGHGTVTSSAAAGNHVLGVSHFGYARGTASGIAPRAHIAMYKAIFATSTAESAASDVLAAMDKAISDGIDIMSLSLGFNRTSFFDDLIGIASLSAIKEGIFVVCAAGNVGAPNTTFNGAPWITTVGAGTLDRSFTGTVTLKNGLTMEGTSYFPVNVQITDASLFYGMGNKKKATCYPGELNPREVHGKIVLCDNSTKIHVRKQKQEVERVGAYGGIFMADLSPLFPFEYTIPSLVLSNASGALVRHFLTKGVSKPKVKTMGFMTTKLGTKPAPQVAYFSSRGPDPINPGVLKPDILAPGVDVLAAVVPNRPFTQINKYDVVTDYALHSGTSLAAPQVAGVAALLKNIHPEWSPAAIRSAMMTTSYIIDNTGTILRDQRTRLSATPLDFGAGHINPNKAMNPGLIYDMGFQDYIDFLCSLGYNQKQMRVIIRQSHWNCSREPTHLNYPSFMAIFSNESDSPTAKKFSRVVTNVGDDTATYRAILEKITPGIRLKTEPSTLSFTQKYQKKGFSVSVEIDKEAPTPSEFYGFLKWVDEHNHTVSSPIVAIKF